MGMKNGKYNVFIEGIPGSGKTTLLEKLSQRLPDYNFYREGDISPIELAWCAYVSEETYEKILSRFPELYDDIQKFTQKEKEYYIIAYTKIHTGNIEFYQYLEKFELYSGRRTIEEFTDIVYKRYLAFQSTGNVFECSFFQNIIDEFIQVNFR